MAMTEEQRLHVKALANTVLHEPFTARPWKESAFFLLGAGLAGIGLAFVTFTMGAGVILAITIFGLALLALSLRSARGIGGLQRNSPRKCWPGGGGPRALPRAPRVLRLARVPPARIAWPGAAWPTWRSRCPGPSWACSLRSAAGGMRSSF